MISIKVSEIRKMLHAVNKAGGKDSDYILVYEPSLKETWFLVTLKDYENIEEQYEFD